MRRQLPKYWISWELHIKLYVTIVGLLMNACPIVVYWTYLLACIVKSVGVISTGVRQYYGSVGNYMMGFSFTTLSMFCSQSWWREQRSYSCSQFSWHQKQCPHINSGISTMHWPTIVLKLVQLTWYLWTYMDGIIVWTIEQPSIII